MSFELNLGFGGMCLFVPELNAGNPTKMHVLMPRAHGHNVFLVYDELAPDGDTNGVAVSERIDKRAFDLTRLGTSPALTLPPPEVADLGRVGRAVPRALLTDDFSTNKTVGRVTFAAGRARVPGCAGGARWQFAHAAVPLPIRVIWQIRVNDTKLDLEVPDSTVPSGTRTVTLKPSTSTNVLDVWFLHSPAAPTVLPLRTNVANLPGPGDEAKHFHAYFDLLGHGPHPPTFNGLDLDPTTPNCYESLSGVSARIQGLDVMCIAATAPLAP